ncbi:hypothetical protein L198_04051 [Cryptococcus wingfieldii CBS 7118]|uniref:cytochrome-b5 reductase n=1 Tax=Cryptococcus wingfieldii CBS 7118 TaxID=1295528 RepID=A0A1E3J9F6_9TREE|nr:hypothetical protein L198_04051 [Cryptococcus wingfieldii CBS 7118]ODN97484.1 hypothetical protein L198_04051 [Cryptococcus wingfieldii CBS 7118]
MTQALSDSWVPFTLVDTTQYNHNTRKYRFSFPDGEDKVIGGEVAMALGIKPEDEHDIKDDKGNPVMRPYTPISPPGTKGHADFLIKEYANGKISPYLASLKPGDTALFKGPFQKFVYQPNTHSLKKPEDKTKWTLLYGNVTEEDILLREEFDELLKQHPDRLAIHHVIEKPSSSWTGDKGYITAETIQKAFPRPEGSQETVRAFVCGPPGQMKAICGMKDGMKQGTLDGALKDIGYEQSEVFKY